MRAEPTWLNMEITALPALRELYPEPAGRAVLKQLTHLDAHCARFGRPGA